MWFTHDLLELQHTPPMSDLEHAAWEGGVAWTRCYLTQFGTRYGVETTKSKEAFEACLQQHAWPGGAHMRNALVWADRLGEPSARQALLYVFMLLVFMQHVVQ